MQIYKQLPKTNCKKCGFPTCMAFAMQVAAQQKAITDCPDISDEATSALSEESSPPMKLVHIGPAGEAAVEVGQETVMFRHEEKFHKAPALAVTVPASLSDEDAMARLDKINEAVFTRIGQELSVRLAAVDLEGLEPDKAAARVKALAGKSRVPFVIMTGNPEVMGAAAGAIAPSQLIPTRLRSPESALPLASKSPPVHVLGDCCQFNPNAFKSCGLTVPSRLESPSRYASAKPFSAAPTDSHSVRSS